MLVGKITVLELGASLAWCAGLEIDADGAATAYSAPGSGLVALDYLANAGRPGNWYGLACDGDGQPYVQRAEDPAPGYYVSTTALVDPTKEERDPRRYVDSLTVPYLSVPPELIKAGVRKGDLAWVNLDGLSSSAIVADASPHGHLGEGSIALAQTLGLPASPKSGGIGRGVRCVVFLRSAAVPAWPRDLGELSECAAELFDLWGGAARLSGVV